MLHILSLLGLMLWRYPWEIHLLLVGIFVMVGMVSTYLPIKKVLQRTPLDNIRHK